MASSDGRAANPYASSQVICSTSSSSRSHDEEAILSRPSLVPVASKLLVDMPDLLLNVDVLHVVELSLGLVLHLAVEAVDSNPLTALFLFCG
jgi:hypothetical protein